MARREGVGVLPAHLSAAEVAALRQFAHGARALLGADLLELRLFGSRCRGRGAEGSDVDVAVVTTPAGRERRRELHDLAFDLQLSLGVELAPLVIEAERLEALRSRERRLALDLDREGIPL